LASETPRTTQARDLALEALITLIVRLGPHAEDVVVIGGLNPDLLTDQPPAPHQGTNDIDLLLQVGFVYERDDDLDFSWLERALLDSGFEDLGPGWRWRMNLHGLPVVLEVMCDTPDNPDRPIALPGTRTLAAMNLAGPAPALNGTLRRTITVPDTIRAKAPSAPTAVTIRFAGLGGYVLAKAAAVHKREAPKDLYDLAFVLLYNTAGGPQAAGAAARNALPPEPTEDHRGLTRAAMARFASASSVGPRVFAETMRASNPDLDAEVLAQDAVGAAAEFLTSFAPPELESWQRGTS
jgi:hypothetical protein